MDYQELQSAVFDAYRRRDYALCFSLLDGFADGAQGEALGQGLSLKAMLLPIIDHRRCAEGLALVDKALECLSQDPAQKARTLITGLFICYQTCDTERARRYELLGNQLVDNHGSSSDVTVIQWRFHLNLGLFAMLRGEFASAYWHFVQGTSLLRTFGMDTNEDPRKHLFWLYLHTANACVRMGRMPEAQESLEQAQNCIVQEKQRVRWAIEHADFLRHNGRSQEAASVLEQLVQVPASEWDSETRAKFYLGKALVAQDMGNLRSYHELVSAAQSEAIANSLDVLLSEIQRVQRAPIEPKWTGGLS